MQDDETIAVYNNQVEDYAKVVEDIKPRPVLLDFISKFSKGDFILDLGCGPADASAHMKAAGLRIDAVDASSEMVRMAIEKHNVDARLGTFDDITEVDTYDGIWASFSLLHAPQKDFPRYLKNLHTALKPNGIFHIGMKLGEGEVRDSIGRMYSYYSEEELKSHLEQSGFTILDIRLGEGKGLAGDISQWIHILSQANQNS